VRQVIEGTTRVCATRGRGKPPQALNTIRLVLADAAPMLRGAVVLPQLPQNQASQS